MALHMPVLLTLMCFLLLQDIYGAKFFVNDIPAQQLTHLAYAFANVDNKTGEV